MLGVNLLVRLGRHLLAGAVADSGLLPAEVYRHLALAALEEQDFPGALHYLRWAEDPLLAQLLVLRLRLLARQHARQRQAIADQLKAASGTGLRPVNDPGRGSLSSTGRRPVPLEKYQDLLRAEDQALGLLGEYEAQALAALADIKGRTMET
jgi:hypothetical protein